MNPSLADIQNNFSKSLRYQLSGEECGIISDNFSADERIQIYRNNFVINLTEILTLTYPLVSQLVGIECFKGLARKHILNNPPISGEVSSYGRDFNNTIDSTKSVSGAVPYLSDIAKLEWSIDKAIQHCSEFTEASELRPFSELSSLTQEQQSDIILFPQESMALISSSFSVFSIRQAILSQSFDQLVVDKHEQGFVYCQYDLDIVIKSLPFGDFKLLSQLDGKIRLGAIDPNLLVNLPNLLTFGLFAGFYIK